MHNVAYVFAVYVSLLTVAYADDIPSNNNLPPPAATMPQGTYPMIFTDFQTQSSPMGNLDTMQTQSVGTYGDSHPRSHPIPLDQP